MADTTKKQPESWVKSKWRPGLAWAYFSIIIFDFIIGPISRYWFSIYTSTDHIQWSPLTLEGGSIFHMSMATILGVTAYTRGQEKIKRMDTGNVFPPDDFVDGEH